MQHIKVLRLLLFNKVTDGAYTEWVKLALKVLGSQILVQVMGLCVSILLIREMPKEDYAIYTVLVSVQSMLVILSDSGMLLGFNAIGGKVWQDEGKFASLIKTASYLRVRFTLLAFIVTGVYGISILLNQDVPLLYSLLFIGSILLMVSPEIQKAFIQQALLLKKEVGNVQLASVIYQGARLLLIVAFFLLLRSYISIQTVLFITVVSVWLSFLFILNKSKHIRHPLAKISSEYKTVLLHYIKINWHNAAFFSFQGQISIFLIGILGTTANLAELGALTRYSLIFAALTALVTNILSPAFGRCQEKSKLVRTYALSLLAVSFLTVVTLLVVYFFPSPFLWILGEQYQQLSYELFLVFVSSLVSLASGTIFHLNSFKGWIKFTPYWEIPANIIALTTGVLLFDITTIEGVLHLSILGASTNLFLYAANSFAGFRELSKAV